MKLIEEHNQVDLYFKINGIIPEKMVLFRDFLLVLVDELNKTYLGSEYIRSENDMKNHFRWCYKYVVDKFKNEKVYFKYKGECFVHLWLFFYGSFYMHEDDNAVFKLNEYINHLFSYEFNKNDIDMNILSEFYDIMNKNLIN